MNLHGISINHRTAQVELRESLFLNEDEIKKVTKLAKEGLLKEGLVLSTCNRTEIFGIPHDEKFSYAQLEKLFAGIKSNNNVTGENYERFFSKEAVRHLFRVVTGIDSLLVGDNQIYKQVKESFLLSEELGFAGFIMRRIFDSSIRTGKRAITETKISDGAVTVSYAAVQLIEKIFSNLTKKSALVIGAGETGEIAAKHLSEKNIGNLAITNRTKEKADKLAKKLNVSVVEFSEFKKLLHNYDIVISATSSPEILLRRTDVQSAIKLRNNDPMVLMDIAVPRDIDPETRKIDSVFYHDIDSLNIIVKQNLAKRKAEIPKVEKIIEDELDNIFNWYNSLQASPTIKELRELFENIRAEEVEKNINKFSGEDREKLEIVTKRIINKILHHPTVELKKDSDSDLQTVTKFGIIRNLFGLDENNKEKNS